jgi:integrase/recombinase XerD
MENEVNAFLSKLETDPAYSESTQLAYANDLRVFLRFLEDQIDHPPGMDDFNTEQVARFITAERERGWSRNTLIRRLATLKNFQDFLVQTENLSNGFFSADDEQVTSVINELPERIPANCLNLEQIQSILAIMDSSSRPRALRDRAIFMLLLESGLSVGHLTDLDMTDVDLAANRFHVYLEWTGDMWLGLGEAAGSVREYIQEGRPNLLHRPGEPALFISQMDGRLSRQGIWQILKYWGSQADPVIELSPRLVRHAAVLRMNQEGLPVGEIQKRLGHSNRLSTQALIRRLEANCGLQYQETS